MTSLNNHQKVLLFFAFFSFSWPFSNKTLGLTLTITFAILWIAGYFFWITNYFFVFPSPIVNLLSQFNVLVMFLVGLALWASGYRNNNRINIIWKRLRRVDRILRCPATNYNLQMCASVFIWFSFILNAFLSVLAHADTSGIHFIFNISYFISLCASYSVFAGYVNIVKTIRTRFQIIFEKIEALKGEFNEVKRKNQLVLLQCAHLDMYHIIDIINSTFGVSIFAIISASFMQTLSAMYMFSFSVKCLGIKILFGSAIFKLLSIVPNVIIIVYIAIICEITTNMVSIK